MDNYVERGKLAEGQGHKATGLTHIRYDSRVAISKTRGL